LVGGSEAQKREYLPLIATGKKLISFGLSEKYAGSDAQGLRCRATRDGDEYVLDGEKKWNTNGGAANLYTIFAVTDPESKSRRISAFLLDRDDGYEGFEIAKVEDKMGIRCVPVVELQFKNCRVPATTVLGGEPGYGFKHAMQTLDMARPGVAAQGIGLAQGAFEYALLYATKREQFGAPISSFQMIQQMLADMATKIEAARQLVYASAMAVDEKRSDANKLAAMAKCYATDVAMEVTTQAVQIFGGYGYMKDYPIEKYMRDAKITQIYEGTNQVQRLVIARNLIKEARNYQFLEKYIPTEIQRGYNDPETRARQEVPAARPV
jgi:butyryl-CoA dehydrogenase